MHIEVEHFDGTPAAFQARTAAFDRRLWIKYKPPFPRLGMLIYKTGPAVPPNAVEVVVAVHPEATLEEAVNRPMSDGTYGRVFPVIAEQTKASITATALASGSQLQLVCIDEAAWPIVQEHWRRLLEELGIEGDTLEPPLAENEAIEEDDVVRARGRSKRTRQTKIRRLFNVEKRTDLTIAQMAKLYGVSRKTIERDLEDLGYKKRKTTKPPP